MAPVPKKASSAPQSFHRCTSTSVPAILRDVAPTKVAPSNKQPAHKGLMSNPCSSAPEPIPPPKGTSAPAHSAHHDRSQAQCALLAPEISSRHGAPLLPLPPGTLLHCHSQRMLPHTMWVLLYFLSMLCFMMMIRGTFSHHNTPPPLLIIISITTTVDHGIRSGIRSGHILNPTTLPAGRHGTTAFHVEDGPQPHLLQQGNLLHSCQPVPCQPLWTRTRRRVKSLMNTWKSKTMEIFRPIIDHHPLMKR